MPEGYGSLISVDKSGVLFKLDPTGTETVLCNFTGGADGDNPQSGLLQDGPERLAGERWVSVQKISNAQDRDLRCACRAWGSEFVPGLGRRILLLFKAPL